MKQALFAATLFAGLTSLPIEPAFAQSVGTNGLGDGGRMGEEVTPSVIALPYGIFRSPFMFGSRRSPDYVVDSVAQLCFVAHKEESIYLTIPCANLKKRKEWAKIINW